MRPLTHFRGYGRRCVVVGVTATLAAAVGAIGAVSASNASTLKTGAALSALAIPPGCANAACTVLYRPKPVKGSLHNATIDFVSWSSTPFFDPMEAGVKAAAAALKDRGVTVRYVVAGPSLTLTYLVTAMQDAVINGVTAMGADLLNGACPEIKAVVKAGVIVSGAVSQPACAQAAGSLFYVAQNSVASGQTAANLLAKSTNCKGPIGVIDDPPANSSVGLRTVGFLGEIKKLCPGIKLLGPTINDDTAASAYSITSGWITGFPGLTGIYESSAGDNGAAAAIKSAGKDGIVKFVGHDFVPANVDLLNEGAVQDLIGQDPYGEGYNTIIDLFNYLVAHVVPKPYNQYTVSQVMTTSNEKAILATQG